MDFFLGMSQYTVLIYSSQMLELQLTQNVYFVQYLVGSNHLLHKAQFTWNLDGWKLSKEEPFVCPLVTT